MIKMEMKNCNLILIEKQRKDQHYHLEKLINMNILQVRKSCLQINQIREKNKLNIPLQEKLLTTKKKTIEDQGEKQIKAIEENKKNK